MSIGKLSKVMALDSDKVLETSPVAAGMTDLS